MEMRRIVLGYLFLLTLLFFTGINASGDDKSPERLKIDVAQEKMPPVSMPHWEHQERVKAECVKCHHNIGEDYVYSCSRCHGVDDKIPDLKDAMHEKCKGCHEVEVAAGGGPPLDCGGCHSGKSGEVIGSSKGSDGEESISSSIMPARVVFSDRSVHTISRKSRHSMKLVFHSFGKEVYRKDQILYIYSGEIYVGRVKVCSVYSDEVYTQPVDEELFKRVEIGNIVSILPPGKYFNEKKGK